MKRKLTVALLALLCLTGCAQAKTEPEHTTYITQGRYYTCGEVVTEDGNAWVYSQSIISERESYDHEPVFALFDDNGTPGYIYDDELYGVVLDMETAIYDELEAELSKEFAIERNGNTICILQD